MTGGGGADGGGEGSWRPFGSCGRPFGSAGGEDGGVANDGGLGGGEGTGKTASSIVLSSSLHIGSGSPGGICMFEAVGQARPDQPG